MRKKAARSGNPPKQLLILISVGLILISATLIAAKMYLNTLVNFPSSQIATYQPKTPAYRPDPRNIPFTNAVRLNPGETVLGYIKSSDDTNYYAFSVTSRSDVTVDAQSMPKDYDLVLYTPDISFVVRSMSPDPTRERVELTLNAGNYYFRIYSKSGDYSNNPYKVTLLINPLP